MAKQRTHDPVSGVEAFPAASPPSGPQERGLLAETRRVPRLHLHSLCIEQVYVAWVFRFVLVNGKRHPRDMGSVDMERFLSGLAVHG